MKKVITYGTYDLLHYGHIRLLQSKRPIRGCIEISGCCM